MPKNIISNAVLFDKIASVYFIWRIYLYFSIGNGQPREPALCQLYQRTFVPYRSDQTLWSTIQELAFYLRRRWPVAKTLTNVGPQDQQQMHQQHQSVNLRPYSISPNLDSDTQWMQIRTHWQIEWPGFVNVVECDVIVVCLRWWCWCDIILPLSISGFASESASKLDSRTKWTISPNPTRLRNDLYCVEWGVKLYSNRIQPKPDSINRIHHNKSISQTAHQLRSNSVCTVTDNVSHHISQQGRHSFTNATIHLSVCGEGHTRSYIRPVV